jgi:hypothetical protein
VLDEVERAVVGKRDALELVLLGLLADGHVLLDDYPGLAKTLIARSFAQVTSLGFARVQFTPDLMPSDVTGSSVYNQRLGDFEFRPGPVFTNLLLGDEINRSPPKTQAALLEAMQERQVTIDGVSRPLERPFLVVATQNPIEFEGTYPLPEAQLDRFLLRLSVGYPSAEAEWRMLERRLERADRRGRAGPGGDPGPTCSRCSGRSRRCMWPRASAATSSSWSAPPGPAPGSRSGPAPGQPGPAQGGQGQGRPQRPRLRHPRGRQGGGRAHPGPPADPAS